MSQYTRYPVLASGSGSVTSVGLAAPAFLTVSGSPVTTSGTLTLTLATQTANTVFAGPSSGPDAAPTFRSLVAADIPSLPYLSSTLTSAHIFVGSVSNVATDVALSGDAALSNAGVLTLATVNGNVGSFGSASQTLSLTANAKGLITAVSAASIQIAESQVTNLVSDLAAKQSTTLTNAHILVGNGSNVAADVAASGDLSLANTGAFTIANSAVTYAKIQNVSATNQLLGRKTAGAGVVEEIGLQASLSIVGGLLGTTGLTTSVTKTANYTILSTDSIILVNTLAIGAFTLTLPNPSGMNGKIYRIIDIAGNLSAANLTLAPFGAEKIEGIASSRVFQTDWAGWMITTDGTDWFIK